jgi:hypothetical protein
MATNRSIDWNSASVRAGRLTVDLIGTTDEAWDQALRWELNARLRETQAGVWGEIEYTGGGLSVDTVGEGSEPEVRRFLDALVESTNNRPQRDPVGAGKARERRERNEDEDPQSDQRMTERFKAPE